MRYGGFWARVVASLVDGFLLNIVFAILGGFTGLRFFGDNADWSALVIALLIGWLYEAVMTSSERGATFGKMAVGLRVVDGEGGRLTFLHAAGRYLAKLVSVLTLNIGFLMVAFTERKRGLHDMIAGTLVVKTS